VTGKAKVGKKLTAVVAVPAGSKATYQWFKGAKAIKGAKARTLKVTKALRGAKLSVKVTVSRAGYATTTVASAKTAKVKKK
jgi:alpha-L-rhamnosidase